MKNTEYNDFEHEVHAKDLEYFDDWKNDNKGCFNGDKYADSKVYVLSYNIKYHRLVSEFSALGQPFCSFADEFKLASSHVSFLICVIQ